MCQKKVSSQKIFHLMKEKHETPAEFSRATGIPQNTISNWKSRNGGVSLQNAIVIAEHFQVDLTDLLSESK